MQTEPFRSMAPHEQQQTLLRRLEQLEAVRRPLLPTWQEVGHFFMPNSPYPALGGMLAPTRDGRKLKRDDKHIFDNTGSISVRHTAAGLMAHGSSPSKQWHKLMLRNKEMADRGDVAEWLANATDEQRNIFRDAQVYPALHQMYLQLLVYGTAVAVVMPHPQRVMQMHLVPIGFFCLDTNNEQKVDTLYREMDMSVRQLIEEFGEDRVSQEVRSFAKQRQWEKLVRVVHAIEPRALQDQDIGSPRATAMPWRSCYFERNQDAKGLLRESGFHTFPVLAPRWEVEPGEVYCRVSPAIAALGDVKGLQHAYKRLSQAIDYRVRPPLDLPVELANKEVDLLPGGKNFTSQQGPQGKTRAIWEVQQGVQELAELMEGMRERIRETTFANLFYLINSLSDTTPRTKAEVDERNAERLHLLGPAQENMQDELHRPLVELGFQYQVEAGRTPPPPQDIQDQEYEVQFVSALAQAQQSADIFGIEKIMGITANLAAMDPNATDKLDADVIIDRYGSLMGVPPEVIRDTADVQKLREARQRALAAKEQVEAMQQASVATKNLGTTPSGGGSVLDELQSSVFSAI